MNTKLLLTPMIGALSLCLAGPAQAQEQREVVYSDLNLATEAGLRQFDRRIDKAVRLVCAANGATREQLKIAMAQTSCIKESSARAMAAKADVLAALEKGEGSRLAVLTVSRAH